MGAPERGAGTGGIDDVDARGQTIRGDLFLLGAAVIWGSGFVAQRAIAEHVGSLTFNGFRNLIAMVALLPFVWLARRGNGARGGGTVPGRRLAWAAGAATGGAVFVGGWIQQLGIAQTTAGNAGFITGLYVVFVPLQAALVGARLPAATWPAALLATVGMYLLSASGDWTLGRGDLLVLVSAVIWGLHVHAVGYFARRVDALWLTWLQLAFATAFSLPLALASEPVTWDALRAAGGPLLYTGLAGGALAFTLQISGQRHAPPAHAAILMGLEAVFAAFFGWWLLDERLGGRGWVGAGLMLTGSLVSQWPVPARVGGRRRPGQQ